MSEDKKQIYQQKALDKLKAPERMDRLFSVTKSIGWLALAAALLAVFSAVVWAVFGILADKVVGYGILLGPGGAAVIAPTSGGRVQEMYLRYGDVIRAGDIVAVIEQPGIERSLYQQLEQLDTAQNSSDFESRVAQLMTLKEQLHRDSQITSPYNAVVTEVKKRTGDVVQAGEALYAVKVEEKRGDMLACVYVPALEGGRIKEGMRIQVSPGSVDASTYGSLLGRVLSVSEYPVTKESIVYRTGNPELAAWIQQRNGGAVLEVIVELIKDEETASGYLWTSLLGPDETVRLGTVCTANAIVKREAPVVKAFQKLSQWLRSD